MARSFKLKCRLFISSFRICRSRYQHPLTFPKPFSLESSHYKNQFPANPRSCYLCYPSPPSPPPSTPVGFFADPSMENSPSVCCSCKLESYARENGLLQEKENRVETEHKVSGEKKQSSSLFSWIARKKSKTKKKLNKMGLKRNELNVNRWSKGYEGEEDKGSEKLVNSSGSFSEEGSSVKRIEAASCVKKVGGSFVQMKRSKEPQEDFKRSMVQMILEKEIFEGKGLEELLQCYLTLNSPEYHQFIVGAFSEVCEFLFRDSNSCK